MTPTPEQARIISAARDSTASLMVNAMAGCAKTTTLVMLANAIPESGVALAFNVRIKQELERKFPKTWTVMTLNGLGHRAWGKATNQRLVVEEKKLGKIITQLGKPLNLTTDEWLDVRQLVSGAMNRGLVPSQYPHKSLLPDTLDSWLEICEDLWINPEPRLIGLARAVLVEDVRQGFQGNISFDDQVYLSAMLGGLFPRFPLTLVDEAQDLSPLNHLQLAKCSAGRIIAVGDPKQAIYSFRGAHSHSMAQIRKLRPEWLDLPLTMTFRCPQRVVARQQDHAPGFTAAPTNAIGRVLNGFREKLQSGEEHFGQREGEQQNWTWDHIAELGHQEVAILSRNNAQLISMAFKLLRRRVGCRMLGRDIGRSLVSLSKKILPSDETPAEACVLAIEEWRKTQSDLAWANSKEEKVAGIVDRAESLLAVLEGSGATTAGDLRRELERLFARESGSVVLSTVHKAKGLEWDVVVHLDPWRIPSRFAKKQAAEGNHAPLAQENNLRYVCETRAKHALVLVNLEDLV